VHDVEGEGTGDLVTMSGVDTDDPQPLQVMVEVDWAPTLLSAAEGGLWSAQSSCYCGVQARHLWEVGRWGGLALTGEGCDDLELHRDGGRVRDPRVIIIFWLVVRANSESNSEWCNDGVVESEMERV
jgi:hypothetical protein